MVIATIKVRCIPICSVCGKPVIGCGECGKTFGKGMKIYCEPEGHSCSKNCKALLAVPKDDA